MKNKITDSVKKMFFGGVLAVIILTAGCEKKPDVSVKAVSDEQEQEESGSKAAEEGEESMETVLPEEEQKVYVQVCGAVNHPGVYYVSGSMRVFEVLELAGGVTGEAETDTVNLARPVFDEMVIAIPEKGEIVSSNGNESDCYGQLAETTSLININTADRMLLMTLPGIGEAKAGAILAYRSENGSFQKIEDIMKVEGIKQAAFEKIREKITVK